MNNKKKEYTIENKKDIINIYKNNQCIRISKKHEIYLQDILKTFDFYFNSVKPKKQSKYQLVDFSSQEPKEVKNFNLFKVKFPSFVEPIETTKQYIDFAKLDENSVVLDLGAYSGLTSILFDMAISQNNKQASGKVIAVDPDKFNTDCIKFNFKNYYKKTKRNIEYLNAAIWSNDEEINFAHDGNMGASSTNIVGERGDVSTTKAITLSSIAKKYKLNKIDFIKCDVEGAEIEIFKDEKFFELYSPKIIIETHYLNNYTSMTTTSVIEQLKKYNYDIKEVKQDGFDLPLLECTPIKQKTHNQPLVSVFLPYYNDEDFLAETIESILNQTYQNFELILFNHKSTDNSRNIAHSYQDHRIKHIDANENLGAGSGLNSYQNLDKMNGKYIKLFCADDTMEPNCIENMVRYMENHPEKDFAISDTYIIDENSNRVNELWSEKKSEINFNMNMSENEILKLLFMRHSPIAFPSNMIKKEAINPIFLDKSYIHLFDVNLWSSLIISGKKLAMIDKPLMSYRISKNQVTSIFKDIGNAQTTFFETAKAQDLYYTITDYEQLKAICNNSQYIDKITKDDTWAFEFVIAHYMLETILGSSYAKNFASYRFAIQINAYQKIHDLLENDEIRNKLKEKFNFGIREFRHLYTFVDKHTTKDNSLKSRMFHLYKRPKELNFIDLSFLFIRQIFNLITLRTFKDMIKEWQRNKNDN